MTAEPWPQTLTARTLFSEDLPEAIAFYTRFLNSDPHWGDAVSSVFRAGPTMINLLQVAAVPALIEPATMAPPGIRAVYTLTVSNVDAEAARLTAAGLTLLNGPIDRPWGIRSLSLQDPAGHVWELAQTL